MGKLVLFFVFAFLGYSQSATIQRTIQEIRNYDNFLKSTMEGTLSEPLTPELAELQNIEERSGKFEGDILLTEEQRKAMVAEFAGVKNGLTATNRLWPNGVVVYQIAPSTFTAAQVSAIRAGIAEMDRVSCLTFRERTNEAAHIYITGASDGCYATVGYTGNRQTLNLALNTPGAGCFRHGTIVHEFLHGLGFYHMQSTHDRDDWVEILWQNIQSGTEHNFNKYTSSQVTNLGEDYDYGSCMHYSEYGFSVNGQKTINPIRNTNGAVIGQRVEMSPSDIRRLNRLYNCPGF